ncbi:MAG TPA: hypothetical protein VGW40_08995 [Allosphingosinicella sp.]|nr:hypothetical protein [Allosphingosinicella sp.]
MAVVINEFEAVAEPAPARSADAAGAAERGDRLTPAELRRPLQILAARRARLRAH